MRQICHLNPCVMEVSPQDLAEFVPIRSARFTQFHLAWILLESFLELFTKITVVLILPDSFLLLNIKKLGKLINIWFCQIAGFGCNLGTSFYRSCFPCHLNS